jgi:hypothetical protein
MRKEQNFSALPAPRNTRRIIFKSVNIASIISESFYHDGCGPELKQVHYIGQGAILRAIDYFNPDEEYAPENLKHLLFLRAQVFMFTPEEVYNYESAIKWGEYNNAYIAPC